MDTVCPRQYSTRLAPRHNRHSRLHTLAQRLPILNVRNAKQNGKHCYCNVATRCSPAMRSQRRSARMLSPPSASLSSSALFLSSVINNDIQYDNDVITSIIGVGALLGLSYFLFTSTTNESNDPAKRRRDKMTSAAGGDEMTSVKDYFNNSGFERWKKIYGDTDEVNTVQLDIRTGHAQTVSKVLSWMKDYGNKNNDDGDEGDWSLKGVKVCDAGCGTGSLSIPLALRGAEVYGSDISSAMVGEASQRYQKEKKNDSNNVVFEAKDLESIEGEYDCVACLDVMIHYPQEKVDDMIQHLTSLAKDNVIVSFAPKTPSYELLKRIGELFPGKSKATRAYLHKEEDVIAALNKNGWEITRKEMTATRFYFSRLLEAKPMQV